MPEFTPLHHFAPRVVCSRRVLPSPGAAFSRPLLSLAAFILCAALQACGGGGSDSPPPATNLPLPPPSGVLDTSFGSNGVAVLSPGITSGFEYFSDAEALPDGGLMLGGGFITQGFSPVTVRNWFALRLDAAGRRDPAFGANGMSSYTSGIFVFGNLERVRVNAQGQVLMIGQRCPLVAERCGPSDFAQISHEMTVLAFDARGQRDTTYGTDGSFSRTGYRGRALDAVLQEDGKLAIFTTLGGQTANDPSTETWLRVTREGQQDAALPAFPVDALPLTSTYPVTGPFVPRLLRQPDGKLLVTIQRSVARFTADGVLDTAFAGRGFTQFTEDLVDAAVHPVNGFTVIGRTSVESNFTRRLFRFAPDGTATALASSTLDELGTMRERSVAVQADGKILIAGIAGNSTANGPGSSIFLARRQADGRPDMSFGANGNGIVITPLGAEVAAPKVLVDSAGRIVVAGLSGNQVFAVRFLP